MGRKKQIYPPGEALPGPLTTLRRKEELVW